MEDVEEEDGIPAAVKARFEREEEDLARPADDFAAESAALAAEINSAVSNLSSWRTEIANENANFERETRARLAAFDEQLRAEVRQAVAAAEVTSPSPPGTEPTLTLDAVDEDGGIGAALERLKELGLDTVGDGDSSSTAQSETVRVVADLSAVERRLLNAAMGMDFDTVREMERKQQRRAQGIERQRKEKKMQIRKENSSSPAKEGGGDGDDEHRDEDDEMGVLPTDMESYLRDLQREVEEQEEAVEAISQYGSDLDALLGKLDALGRAEAVPELIPGE